jgi:hypothetical protein
VIRATVVDVVLIGEPDIALGRKPGGYVDVDAGRAPHVMGTIEIGVPPADVLARLDPRLSPRIRVHVSVNGAGVRTFDLGLRRRPRRFRDGTLQLDLASDEAILLDYAPLVDDQTPLQFAASLRDVVDYVLGAAIPGAQLADHPSVDADTTPLWDATNDLRNPNAATNAAHWFARNCTLTHATGGGVGGVTGYVQGNNSVATAFQVWPQATPDADGAPRTVRPGDSVVGAAWARTPSTPAVSARIRLAWFNDAGNIIGWSDSADIRLTTTFQRIVAIGTAPKGAVRVGMVVHGTSTATGVAMHVDAAILTGGPFDPGFFDGGTAATVDYLYEWVDAANASPSRRVPRRDAPDPEALVWTAGQSAYEFLRTLTQAAGFRLVCDEARVWTLRDEAYAAPGLVIAREGVNLVDGDVDISRDDEWFDAAVARYTWLDGDLQRQRSDTYAASPTPTRTRLFEFAAAWPGPGFAAYAVRRAAGRGRNISVTMPAAWGAVADQPAALYLSDEPPIIGTAQAIRFDFDADQMTLTARATDTIPAAWALIPPGETWNDSPVGASWEAEEI